VRAKTKIVGQRSGTCRRFDVDGVRSNLSHARVKVCLDLAIHNAVIEIGFDPVFDVGACLRAAVDEGNAGPMTPEFERSNGGGVFAADDGDLEAVIGVGIVVVVADFAQVFTGNTHYVGKVVVTGGDGEIAGVKCAGTAELIYGVHGEIACGAGDAIDEVILADIELVEGGNLTVVLKRLIAEGLGIGAGKRNAADLEQLGSGKECHGGRGNGRANYKGSPYRPIPRAGRSSALR